MIRNKLQQFIILAFLFISIACDVHPPNLKPQKRYEVEYFKACPTFDILFRDKEVIAFISNTGATVTFTSYEPHSISFRKYYYVDVINFNLTKINKTLPEIELIIHNHFKVPTFTANDIHFLNRMKINGFKGMFALYFVPLKTTMVYPNKVKNKNGS